MNSSTESTDPVKQIVTASGRVAIGVLGGISAVVVKFLGQDYNLVTEQYRLLTSDMIMDLAIAYIILTPLLMFLGGVLAWVSRDANPRQLLAIGVAAPAIITTFAGGTKGGEFEAALLAPVTAAHAQAPVEERERTVLDRIEKGVGYFFGYGREVKNYWVVVGSFPDRDQAQKKADEINRESSDLSAFVGFQSKQGIWPVIVGYGTYGEAKTIKEKALNLDSVDDAFLSPS